MKTYQLMLPEDVQFSGNGNPIETSEKFNMQFVQFVEDQQEEDTDTYGYIC